MNKFVQKKLIKPAGNFLYSVKQKIMPRNISDITVRVIPAYSSKYDNIPKDGQAFIVNDIQLYNNNRLPLHSCISDKFTKHNESCPVCKCPMDVLFRVVGSSGSLGLIKSMCPSCTYIKFTSLPAKEWYDNYFSNMFCSSEVECRSIPETDNVIYYATKKYLTSDATVFDVGCGFGEKLKPFFDRGFDVVGIEPSRHRADFARNLLHGNAHCLTIEEALQAEEVVKKAPFGLCYFFHVLEFLLNPHSILEKLHSMMAENGIVYIATGLFNTRNIIQESHFCSIPSTFNQYSLSLLLQNAGFKILDVRIVDAGRTLQIIARKNRDKKVLFNDRQKLKQLSIIKKHIHDELGFSCGNHYYEIITEWPGGSKSGPSWKGTLVHLPSKNKKNIPISFIHKGKDPIMFVK